VPDPRNAAPVVVSAFEKEPVEEETFLGELRDAGAALERAGVAYLVIGGVAGAAYGRPLRTLDIDFFVRPDQAHRALEALEGAGFETQLTAPHWLFKACRAGVVVDVIFCSSGDIYLDDEMLERARVREFRGVRLPLIAPEDLFVLKALAHSEPTARYWFDALGVLAHAPIDWPYLLERARHGPRRICSLLVFGQSIDLMVPAEAIRRLRSLVDDGAQEPRARPAAAS
jgi:predicted nucleotidyltransferase